MTGREVQWWPVDEAGVPTGGPVDLTPFVSAVSTSTTLVEPCPECAVRKCDNCDGSSWDKAADQPAECPCRNAGHPWRA